MENLVERTVWLCVENQFIWLALVDTQSRTACYRHSRLSNKEMLSRRNTITHFELR